MTQTFNYDVFISYSAKDKPAVRELAGRLKADGLRIWLDDWEIQPGDMIGLKVEQGLEQSRTLVLVMSANAFSSDWVTLERHTCLFRDPINAHRRFIPLRLDDSDIKDLLKQFAYVDWRQKSSTQYARLLEVCRPRVITVEHSAEQEGDTQANAVLDEHKDYVQGVAMTADGRLAISGSADNTVRVWEVETSKCVATLEGHTQAVYGVAITADGRRAVSGSFDKAVRLWEIETGKCLAALEGHLETVMGVAITADGRVAISGSADNTVRVWDLETSDCIILEGHTHMVYGVAVTADGRRAVSGSGDKTLRVWDTETGECLGTLEGHTNSVLRVAVTGNGSLVVSGSLDNTVRVWNLKSGKCRAALEGHTDSVLGVAVTADGRRVVSSSSDKTVRVWDIETGKCLAALEGHTDMVYGVAVTADGRRAISGSLDNTVRVWKLPPYTERDALESGVARYTNAKVLLVGDNGVGKSGLAYRLTTDCFVPTSSTDGVWASQLNLTNEAGSGEIEREIWLWDFAGQADYRLIHQLFMDETALALFVFSPQSENLFEGLSQWD